MIAQLGPADIDRVGRALCEGFLVHAAESTDWRDLYKWVNRAAGVVAGISFVHGAEAGDAIVSASLRHLEALAPGTESARARITSEPKGLRIRVAKCLLALTGTTDRAVTS